jgi:hypothetical protein
LNIVQEIISEFEYIAIRNYPNKAWNKKKNKKNQVAGRQLLRRQTLGGLQFEVSPGK